MLILSDNTMTVSYLTKQGGTHSALLFGLAWQILQLVQSLALEIQVCHIPVCGCSFWSVTSDQTAGDAPELPAAGVHQLISPFSVDALTVPCDLFRMVHALPPWC